MFRSVRRRYSELSASQKVPTGVPFYTLYVNRRAGRLIASASPKFITPNVITVFSALISFFALSALWLVDTSSVWLMSVGIALIFAYFLDSADGQLARLRGVGSPFGGWLDHVLDAGRLVFAHFSVAAFGIDRDGETTFLVWPAVFLVSATMIYVGGLLVENSRVKASSAASSSRSGRMNTIRSMLLLPVDFGILCALFLFIPWFDLFGPLYKLLAILQCMYLVAYSLRWGKELSRQG